MLLAVNVMIEATLSQPLSFSPMVNGPTHVTCNRPAAATTRAATTKDMPHAAPHLDAVTTKVGQLEIGGPSKLPLARCLFTDMLAPLIAASPLAAPTKMKVHPASEPWRRSTRQAA